MYKLLIFADSKARADYFVQQSKFVSQEGQKDLYAELSTKVEGKQKQKKQMMSAVVKCFLNNYRSHNALCSLLLISFHFAIDVNVTKFTVQGYKPKILVLKRRHGILRKIFSIQYYWLFTFLLLTLPFRIHFARHCDELHITLAKETSTEIKQDTNGSSSISSRSSWFPSPRGWFSGVSSSVSMKEQNLQETHIPEKEDDGGYIEAQKENEDEVK